MKLNILQSSCHCSADAPLESGSLGTVAVVGNPNTGKTTLFNMLTGLRQHTGNYPGVTVEKKAGQMIVASGGGRRIVDLVDLPGTYSLAAASPDELIVADVLLGQAPGEPLPDAVLIVADASNLERNLFLVSQVIECGLPAVLALNMSDVAESAGLRIDEAALARELGCQVVPIVATRSRGLNRLRAAIFRTLDRAEARPAARAIAMPEPVEQAVRSLQEFLAGHAERLARPVHRVEALRVLLDVAGAAEKRLTGLDKRGPSVLRLNEKIGQLRGDLRGAGIALELAEPQTRYARIAEIMQACVRRERLRRFAHLADRLDSALLHPVAGVLVFLVVMALMFQAIYAGAAPLMNAIDSGFGWLGGTVAGWLPAGAVQSLVRDGLIAGVGAVLVFLPQVLILFAIIAVLEDCGYMARAAFVMDRLLSKVGLSGRSFVPMLACFACAVPGIMAARVIENRRDRIATILVSPLMSCSARLPIYVLLISAFIPNRMVFGLVSLQGLTLFALYAIGVTIAIPMAWLFKRVLLRGRTPALLMEMPGFRWPSVKVVAMRMYDRGLSFLARAGTVILLVTVIVWALSYFPRPARIHDAHEAQRFAARATLAGGELKTGLIRIDHDEAGEYIRQSFLARAGHAIEPAVRPLGWDWRIGTAVLASFPAREVVISTLGTIYNLGHDADAGDGGDTSVQLQQTLRAQKTADGRPAFTPLIAIGLMVFTALCCQCAATLVVIKRETLSWRWPAITFGYMTILAYLATLLVYQVGRALGFA
ncbi:MAG: ferrous iron transport protein B [Phycisphaerae bacterium]|nr:ferrous iron transport protein B [Phycisphaerae bacterium]